MKVSKIIGFYLPWKTTVVQFSPIRSGSTLVFNLLRGLLPRAAIEKQHTYGWYFDRLQVVASVRHPFDCIGSIHQAHKKEPTMDTVVWATERFLNNGGNDVVRVKDRENVRVLRYESFVDDYDIIFDTLEEFLGMTIDDAKREELKAQYCRKSVRQLMESKENFFEWCETTKIHGNHISERDGGCGYGKEIFTSEQQGYLADRCSDYMQAFGYD